jgi:hypothetical protein
MLCEQENPKGNEVRSEEKGEAREAQWQQGKGTISHKRLRAQLPLPEMLLVNNFTRALFYFISACFLFMKPRVWQFCSNPHKVIYLKVLLSRKLTKWSQMVSSPLPPSIFVICISKGVMFMRLLFCFHYVRKKSVFYQELIEFLRI